MTALTRLVLAHRRLVVAVWVLLAVVGGATAATTTGRLGKTFDLPGRPSFQTAIRLAALYRGEGGGQDPTVPVVTAPAGQTVAGPAGRALIGRVERAASLGGRYRVLGYGSTRSQRFITNGGRTAFMLVFTPQAGFGSPDPTPAITRRYVARCQPATRSRPRELISCKPRAARVVVTACWSRRCSVVSVRW